MQDKICSFEEQRQSEKERKEDGKRKTEQNNGNSCVVIWQECDSKYTCSV